MPHAFSPYHRGLHLPLKPNYCIIGISVDIICIPSRTFSYRTEDGCRVLFWPHLSVEYRVLDRSIDRLIVTLQFALQGFSPVLKHKMYA